MQRLRETLALILIALLPFHALWVTAGTLLLFGPDHAPASTLALWKEALLGLILLVAFVEWLTQRRNWLSIDGIDWCIIGLFVIALALQVLRPVEMKGFVYGFKYDFIPLITFFLCRRVEWSYTFQRRVLWALLGSAVIITLYGFASLTLPDEFFRQLGYSDFHSLYKPGSPLAPFQYIQNTDIRRMQRVMSGPNQVGLWLLIPLGIGLSMITA